MDAPPAPEIVAIVAIVTAYNEADRLPATLQSLDRAFPGARVMVADDGSTDGTQHVVLQYGAELVRSPRTIGKGGVATLAAQRVLSLALTPDPPVFVLCDGDLGESAEQLPGLVDAVRRGECDLAVAVFARKVGGGFGVAVGYAHKAIKRLVGLDMRAPISGQRAMRAEVLPVVVPFAPRFGMEIGMTVDAARAGFKVGEIELDLAHRATGRTWRGFVHRARQLKDFILVEMSRR